MCPAKDSKLLTSVTQAYDVPLVRPLHEKLSSQPQPLLFLYLRLYALFCGTLTLMELEETSASFIICLTDEELHVGCGGTSTWHVLQTISETTVLYIQTRWNSLTAYKAL